MYNFMTIKPYLGQEMQHYPPVTSLFCVLPGSQSPPFTGGYPYSAFPENYFPLIIVLLLNYISSNNVILPGTLICIILLLLLNYYIIFTLHFLLNIVKFFHAA